MELVDVLANEIRRVDGAHSLGAGALAEALMPFIESIKFEAVAWMNEDELPDSYPYNAMWGFSKVDGVRLFPVFIPSLPEPCSSCHATEGHNHKCQHFVWD